MDDCQKYVLPVANFLAEAPLNVLKSFRKQSSEAGVKTCTMAPFKEMNKQFPNFEPPGFCEYVKQTDTSNNKEAYDYLVKIETMIQKNVINALKSKFGNDYSQWWHLGVKQEIKSNAMALASQKGEYKDFERFLYLLMVS
jgi:hypothetical protein